MPALVWPELPPHGDRLFVEAGKVTAVATTFFQIRPPIGRRNRDVAKSDPPKRDFEHPWRGEARLRLPEFGGTLILKKCRGDGISLARLGEQPVTVRVRRAASNSGHTSAGRAAA